MPAPSKLLYASAAIIALASQGTCFAQRNEEATVVAATNALTEVMSSPFNRAPQAMIANAHGVAIIPNVIRGGFIVGARHGRGLLFVREADGTWHAPVFITLSGGNIGWQAGVQSSDILLVFRTARSIEGLLSGKITLGADAAVAAGPVGRQGAVATDGQLRAEIFSYSRSRGLFAGLAIDGSVIQIDSVATGSFYRSPGPGQPVVVPPSAAKLTQMVVEFVGQQQPANAGKQTAILAERYSATEADLLRTQLLQLAPELLDLLDPQWQTFLAMPDSIQVNAPHPKPESLQPVIANYQRVATDPQFQSLAARPEFQSVYGLLKHYQQSLSATNLMLQLPPPPITAPNP
jgi:lipid-binding SYLF domain-containing protein